MFAHHAIIKKSSLTNWDKPNTSTTEYFQTKDFIKGENGETLKEFKTRISNGELCMVDMKPYMKEPSDGRKKGQIYIDNIKFIPARINAAERAAASFVQTVFVKGIAFPDINYFLTEYNLKLENFDQYKAALRS